MPGFVDGHGHFTQVANELDWVDLAPPPAGAIGSIEDMLTALRARLGRLAAEHKYILGTGYDESILEEHRHPTKEDLDRVSTDLPIWVVHVSRHMAVGNSMALDQAGIAAATPDPVGGVIVRRAALASRRAAAGGGLGARAADVLPGGPRAPPFRSDAAYGPALRASRHHHRAGRRDRRRGHEDAAQGGGGRAAPDRRAVLSALPARRSAARRRRAVACAGTPAASASAA